MPKKRRKAEKVARLRQKAIRKQKAKSIAKQAIVAPFNLQLAQLASLVLIALKLYDVRMERIWEYIKNMIQ